MRLSSPATAWPPSCSPDPSDSCQSTASSPCRTQDQLQVEGLAEANGKMFHERLYIFLCCFKVGQCLQDFTHTMCSLKCNTLGAYYISCVLCQYACTVRARGSVGNYTHAQRNVVLEDTGFAIRNGAFLAKSPHYFSSAYCARAVLSFITRFGACSARISGDTHTHTQTHRTTTVTLAAHARRGLTRVTPPSVTVPTRHL